MASQFLTAVFELRPTRRKAAALERVRAQAERVFWESMAVARPAAEAATKVDQRKERKAAARKAGAIALQKAMQARLVESVAAGVARDAETLAGSFIELTAKGQDASWPEPPRPIAGGDTVSALTALAVASAKEHEDEARDELARLRKGVAVRPLVLVRERDCRIVRDGEGRLAAVLNIIRAVDPRAREGRIHAGSDATTGEVMAASKRKTVLVIPLACSRWHENRFLSGQAQLKSALVFPRDGRWWMAAQFALAVPDCALSGAAVGVDRGCIYPAATAVVDSSGVLKELPTAQGQEIGVTIVRAEVRRRRQQDRRGWTTLRHVRAVDYALHRLANGIVRKAKAWRAEVVVEKLDEFKRTIVAPRAKGARRGGWRKVLKKAQLGKLEQMLAYKLALAGLPPPRTVFASGTSQTCPACGHRAAENRPEREVFRCVACGHQQHADMSAAVVIARRGVLGRRGIKKGDKLDALHRDMVERLRARDDGGLGPLATQAREVVAAHASADTANDRASGATVLAGQEASDAVENTREGVVAERDGRFFRQSAEGENSDASTALPTSGCGGPKNAG